MNQLLALIRKIILNPKMGTMAIIFVSSIIQKKFSTMNMLDTEPETAEPFFLPRGTIRALFALILLVTSITDYIMGSWSLPDEFHAMTIAVVAYYIGYRSDNAKTTEIKI